MYIPNAFREDDFERLVAFMQANSMATVVSVVEGAPLATHIPIVVRVANQGGKSDAGLHDLILAGHFARANPHWRAFIDVSTSTDMHTSAHARAHNDKNSGTHDDTHVGSRDEPPQSLFIFSGPHAYISPSLYENRESVPTWNFMAVHAYGQPRILSAYDQVYALLEEMVATFEAGYLEQWRTLSDQYRDGMMQGIVAFEMPVTRLEGKFKLSQNRPETDQLRVAQALLGYEDTAAQKIGAAIYANLKPQIET